MTRVRRKGVFEIYWNKASWGSLWFHSGFFVSLNWKCQALSRKDPSRLPRCSPPVLLSLTWRLMSALHINSLFTLASLTSPPYEVLCSTLWYVYGVSIYVMLASSYNWCILSADFADTCVFRKYCSGVLVTCSPAIDMRPLNFHRPHHTIMIRTSAPMMTILRRNTGPN